MACAQGRVRDDGDRPEHQPLHGPEYQEPVSRQPKVRQAIRYLVDYDGLVKTALREGWVINQTFLPNGVMGFVDSHPFTLDIDKAKALLAEAGYPNGFPITVNVASTEQSRMDIAQSLQETFAKVGIQLKILASDQKTVITAYRARKHDMALLTWGIDYFDPATNMSFVVNTDNSDKPASKPLAWRNGWMDEDSTPRPRP